MVKGFNTLVTLWKDYNNASEALTKAMGGTSNEVGEFAEKLVCKYYNAEQLMASNSSADLKRPDGNTGKISKNGNINCNKFKCNT